MSVAMKKLKLKNTFAFDGQRDLFDIGFMKFNLQIPENCTLFNKIPDFHNFV